MFYSILADILVAIHVGYISFVLLGELLILVGIPLGWQWTRNFWFRLVHLAALLYPVYEMFRDIECPLTVWERNLLQLAGQTADQRSFVGRLLHSLMFVECADDSPVWYWVYGTLGVVFVLTLVLVPPRLPWRRRAVTSVATN
jgi:hypothetical protein